MNILFVIDKIEFKYFEFNKLVTSFWLIMELIKRGNEVYITTQERLFLKRNNPFGEVFKVLKTTDDMEMTKTAEIISLNDFSAIFFRPDPPVDIDYINSTYILDYVNPKTTMVLNKPSALRASNEKLYINNFQEFIPENITTALPHLIKEFLKEHKEIVIKPLNRCFSSGVFYLKEGDKNTTTIIDTATNKGTTEVMVQKYLKQIEEGDKRLVYIDGKIFEECVQKIHGDDDFKFNTHSDKFFKKGNITEREKQIADNIKDKLSKDGVYIAGLDVIDGNIIEINLTSPCFFIKEVNELFGTNFEIKIVDKIENLIKNYFKTV